MYRVFPHPDAEEQIAHLPSEALGPLAELFALLEIAPWSGTPYKEDQPQGMLTHAFGGRGMAIYLALEEYREVHLLTVRWLD